METFPLHDCLPRVKVPIPKFFVSIYIIIFCPTSFWGDWFTFLEVWSTLPVFRRCSVGVFHMQLSSWCICGGGGSVESDLLVSFLHHLECLQTSISLIHDPKSLQWTQVLYFNYYDKVYSVMVLLFLPIWPWLNFNIILFYVFFNCFWWMYFISIFNVPVSFIYGWPSTDLIYLPLTSKIFLFITFWFLSLSFSFLLREVL